MPSGRNTGYKLACITNRHLACGDFYMQIQHILTCNNKPDMLVLREKDLSEGEYIVMAERVMQICNGNNTLCVLHYFKNAALKLGADGIHLPYKMFMDMPASEKSCFKVKGVSIHSEEEAVNAQKAGASYIMAGHIFETACKEGIKPRGIGFLQKICNKVSIPVYALGGINENNAYCCIEAGAAGVCMMSAYMKKTDAAL